MVNKFVVLISVIIYIGFPSVVLATSVPGKLVEQFSENSTRNVQREATERTSRDVIQRTESESLVRMQREANEKVQEQTRQNTMRVPEQQEKFNREAVERARVQEAQQLQEARHRQQQANERMQHEKNIQKQIDKNNDEKIAATKRENTLHTQVTGGKSENAPKSGQSNSIYEHTRPDGSKSITYYDEKGRMFSREDYGQQRTHGQLGERPDGRSVPHEHRIDWNDRGPIGKKYRELDGNGKPVGTWISE